VVDWANWTGAKVEKLQNLYVALCYAVILSGESKQVEMVQHMKSGKWMDGDKLKSTETTVYVILS